MSALTIVLSFFLILSSSLSLIFFQLSRDRKKQRDKAREQADRAVSQANQAITDIANVARENGVEVKELLIEASTTLLAESNVWKMDLPYGRWAEFPDNSGRPLPLIRGFWLDAKSRVIGVKMPKGSHYEWHYHPWPETLVGITGVVTVMVDKEVKKLRANTIIYIPENVEHCVMEAPEDSTFLCIWGQAVN